MYVVCNDLADMQAVHIWVLHRKIHDFLWEYMISLGISDVDLWKKNQMVDR